MMAIVRFNWPFYVVAVGVLVLCGVGVVLFPGFWFLVVLPVLGAGYFLVGSLGVSHVVYDLSDLYRFGWLGRALEGSGRGRMIFCHSGFDEASEMLVERFPNTEWVVLDHYDEELMSEASIRRARSAFPPTGGTVKAAFDKWPLADGEGDVVFGILAIHEFRSREERVAWFSEASRCLGEGGRVVLVEHVRDLANFVAFGPGFLHFHSVDEWRKSWEGAGMRCMDEFRITPWVRVFVIEKR